ncbi:MAG: aspartate/glutamate racemase family protein [Sedimentisphaerales bacterium]|nr:aspartate/glutamate racemase family protein [Sedimentisphaerales bacterium]
MDQLYRESRSALIRKFLNRNRLHHWILALILMLSGCSGGFWNDDKVISHDLEDRMLYEPDSPFYLDVSRYPRDNHLLPIGVFDSGTGGLTVLDAIVNFDRHDNNTHQPNPNGDGLRDFQQEYFLYLGDKANMPYGTYPAESKIDLLEEHILKDVQFLLGNQYYLTSTDAMVQTDKPSVKAIVVACNTATAYGMDRIERFLSRSGLDVKVFGIIDAGVQAALQSLEEDEDASIAVFATAGTVSSNGYVRALNAQKDKLGRRGKISIFQQAGIGLAGAIDGAGEYLQPEAIEFSPAYKGPSETHPDARIDLAIWPRYGFDTINNALLFDSMENRVNDIQLNSIQNYIAYHVTSLMEQIRIASDAGKLKVVILGCTHYPFFSEQFADRLDALYNYQENGEYIYRPFMTENIILIDPAPSLAGELYDYLATTDRFGESDLSQSRFFLSVPNQTNPNIQIESPLEFTYEYKYGRTAGNDQEYVKRIPFGPSCLSQDIIDMLSEKMPFLYQIIHQSKTFPMN